MDNLASFKFFWPESVLTLAVVAMLVQDLFVRRSPRRVESLTIGALVWLALTAVAVWLTPWGNFSLFGGLLQHDPLRTFFLWLFLAAGLLTILIVPRSGQVSPARLGEFTALLFALMLGMFLMASATDLLMIYLSIEMVSLVSYVLTSFRRNDRKANEAALKYVIYGGVASGGVPYGLNNLHRRPRPAARPPPPLCRARRGPPARRAARAGGRHRLRARRRRLQDRQRSVPHVVPRRVRGRAHAVHRVPERRAQGGR